MTHPRPASPSNERETAATAALPADGPQHQSAPVTGPTAAGRTSASRPSPGSAIAPVLTPASPPALGVDELVALTGGRLVLRSDRPVRGGAVDSRAVEPGNLFVALPGGRTDGHRFLAAAAAAGATALLVTSEPAQDELAALGDVSVVLVSDGLAALHAVAGGWRGRFDPLVTGVTGSVAKTSTKEAVAAVLARRFVTLKNEGNQNNEIGLPLTLLRLGPEHQAAVLEMGMYVGGEIADLARLARPRIGVVTAVREVHLSRIGSLDAIEQAKGELIEALPAQGVAVLNADDPRVRRMAARTAARSLTYGFAGGADVGATDVVPAGPDGMRFTLLAGGERRPLSTPALGRHAVHNGLAAAAVGLAAGLDLDDVAAGLATGWQAPHRGELIRAGGFTILDDCYNASPSSMLAALELLGSLPGRRVAVLGEMLELGDAAQRGHREVGEVAGRVADLLVVIGPGAAGIADGARAAGLRPGRIVRVADREEALAALRGGSARARPGDVILVKASRGAALEVLVEALAAGTGTAGEVGGIHGSGRATGARR
ncbi:MAG: UDP-N-acetylmuramoyl-tripeptide--D-alanyl-D-alanine ligase [Candidatus Limnocylindrales bacterium]